MSDLQTQAQMFGEELPPTILTRMVTIQAHQQHQQIIGVMWLKQEEMLMATRLGLQLQVSIIGAMYRQPIEIITAQLLALQPLQPIIGETSTAHTIAQIQAHQSGASKY